MGKGGLGTKGVWRHNYSNSDQNRKPGGCMIWSFTTTNEKGGRMSRLGVRCDWNASSLAGLFIGITIFKVA